MLYMLIGNGVFGRMVAAKTDKTLCGWLDVKQFIYHLKKYSCTDLIQSKIIVHFILFKNQGKHKYKLNSEK